MSTRSLIGVERQDGTISAIYCHMDGDPEHNGKILMEHYTDPEKIERLLALGNLSSLGEDIGEKRDPALRNSFGSFPFDGKTCTAYTRDMEYDQQEEAAYVYADRTAFGDDPFGDIDWFYLFSGGHWHVKGHGRCCDFEPLSACPVLNDADDEGPKP